MRAIEPRPPDGREMKRTNKNAPRARTSEGLAREGARPMGPEPVLAGEGRAGEMGAVGSARAPSSSLSDEIDPRSLREEKWGKREAARAMRTIGMCSLDARTSRKMNDGNVLLLILIVFLVMPSVIHAQADAVLDVGKFSAAAPGTEFPDNWKPLTFPKIKRHTAYTLVREGEGVVVKAVSEASSSGLTREITIDPKEYPVVHWRWKVGNLLKKSDVSRKDGDDYPARLYVTFAYNSNTVGFLDKAKYEMARLVYGQYPPHGALNYIWDSKAPRGMIVPNPYTDRAMMIVIESGAADVNRWMAEERNIYEDYKRAFGEEPSLISGVAIMTDTDNTGESATAYYGDIVFKKTDR